jgi:hypothetical protein
MYSMGRLDRSRFDSGFDGEAVNPMDGVANFADVMLVFACGLLLALVINWNIDMASTMSSETLDEAMTEVEESAGGETSEIDDESYAEVGRVYRGADGRLYMVIDDADGSPPVSQ